jgi:hypothetical protein
LTPEQKGYNVLHAFPNLLRRPEACMVKMVVEEAVALTAIALFVIMIAIWAQFLATL